MIRTFTLAAAAAALSTVAFAAETLSGDRIRTIVSGNTVEGSMADTGRYSEFYAYDGTIRGEGYTGDWRNAGYEMCFDYGEGPDCWQVGGDAEEVLWIKDGEVLGSGTVRPGNPNEY